MLRLRKKRDARRPKPKLRFKRGNAPAPASTPFEQIVREAVEVQKELSALEHPGYSTDKVLSASAFLRESLALAKSSAKRIAALRKSSADSPATDATLRRMVTFICGPHCKAPPTRSDRLRFLSNDATTAELAQLGNYSNAELYALAVQIATERQPKIFGSAGSTATFQERLKELEQRHAELFNKINNGWTAEDILAGERDAPPTFRLAPSVTVAPAASAAERLVKALLANTTK